MFEAFIRDTKNGKRRLKNGNRIRMSTINNYVSTLNKVREFQTTFNMTIRLKHIPSLGRREQLKERKYWTKFGRSFLDFMQNQGLLNNYIGFHMKNMKAFHQYLKAYRNIDTGVMNEIFLVLKEEPPIVVLSTERLRFLVYNNDFKNRLNSKLKTSLDIFIFGCTTSLRFGDIANLKSTNLHKCNGAVYLVNQSQKSQIETRIKLPKYCMDLINLSSKRKKYLFPTISLSHFNENLKRIFEMAGWTEPYPKMRFIKGSKKELKRTTGEFYRFCDFASSHIMRKSAITNMLLLGMPESLVRKVSGHAPNSKEFYRYVQYSQLYLDDFTDKVFEKFAKL